MEALPPFSSPLRILRDAAPVTPDQAPEPPSLDSQLGKFRVGSVPYLNAVPLTRGLESEIVLATPARLAQMLEGNELDAALVSVAEVLLTDGLDILDGVAIASLGEVKSVFLAHRGPIEKATVIHCDPASITSVNLMRVLLAERGLHPRLEKLTSYKPDQIPDYALLIGDPALDFQFAQRQHEIWDLGTAWYEMTNLPFVYAVWALRRAIDHKPLRRVLREAQEFGLETLDHIIRNRDEYTLDFRRDYLSWHIHFHLGSDEKRGIAKFVELLRKHGPAPVFDPQYVF